MKGFIKITLLTVCILLAILSFVSSLVLGFRIIQLLWNAAINPSLCLEFLGSALLMGLCIGAAALLSPEPIEFHMTDNTIVGKHDDEDDEG
jgi:hypothetical protein